MTTKTTRLLALIILLAFVPGVCGTSRDSKGPFPEPGKGLWPAALPWWS